MGDERAFLNDKYSLDSGFYNEIEKELMSNIENPTKMRVDLFNLRSADRFYFTDKDRRLLANMQVPALVRQKIITKTLKNYVSAVLINSHGIEVFSASLIKDPNDQRILRNIDEVIDEINHIINSFHITSRSTKQFGMYCISLLKKIKVDPSFGKAAGVILRNELNQLHG